MINAILRSFTIVVLILVGGWYFTTPGWHRAATPSLFGIKRAAPRIFTDAPERIEELSAMVRKAEANANALFGETDANPTYIICTQKPCQRTFGIAPLGLAIGFHRVLISPNGVNQTILNHERLHIDLHRFMGPSDFRQTRFPAWFDEGLATYFASPKPFSNRVSDADKRRVLQAGDMREWNELVQVTSAGYAYGAAGALVGDIVRAIGRENLMDIIRTVKSRDDFMQSLPRSVLN